jgi:hypothetical protein
MPTQHDWDSLTSYGSPVSGIQGIQEICAVSRRSGSEVRKALKKAAQDAGCDFPGFGLHSFPRANITLRQEVGGMGRGWETRS